MKILLLSDIHGNLEALNAVFDFLNNNRIVWDKLVCLGDYVDYGPNPNEVIEIVKGLSGLYLLGNHDKALIDKIEREYFSDVALRCSIWTEKVIKSDNLEFLKNLSPYHKDEGILFIHASPVNPIWHYVYDYNDADEVFKSSREKIIFLGHTHIPSYFCRYNAKLYGGYVAAEYMKLKLLDNARYIINPGSVGQSRDGIKLATFGIFDKKDMTFEWFRIPYDAHKTKEKILKEGLPKTLLTYL